MAKLISTIELEGKEIPAKSLIMNNTLNIVREKSKIKWNVFYIFSDKGNPITKSDEKDYIVENIF